MNGILLWNIIRAAGAKRTCVEIYYLSEKSQERKRYVAVPWSIRAPNMKLTLYIWDVTESKLKQLRVDRIAVATVMEQQWPENILSKVGYPLEVSYPEISGLKTDLQPLPENKPPK